MKGQRAIACKSIYSILWLWKGVMDWHGLEEWWEALAGKPSKEEGSECGFFLLS